VADKSSQLVLDGLARAAAGGTGLPLHGSRTHPGLFPTTAPGKQAAQRCCEEGYLRPAHDAPGAVLTSVPESPTGALATRPRSSTTDSWVITDKGLAYLLRQTSPRQVLEDFVRVLEDREAQLAGLLEAAGRMQTDLAAIRVHAATVLEHLASQPPSSPTEPSSTREAVEPAATNGDLKSLLHERRRAFAEAGPPSAQPDLLTLMLSHLTRWDQVGSSEDCPLPVLFRHLTEQLPGLSIGQFHDALRQAHESGRLYLHPWTGPLHELPEPASALLVGHLVAYYASVRPG
jgi:hypothetical protein